jgi:hypothetical protein
MPAPAAAGGGPVAQGGSGGVTPEIQGMLQNYRSRSVPGIAPVTVGQNQQATPGFYGGAPVGAVTNATGTTSTAGQSAVATVNQGQSNQTRGQQEQNISDLSAASRGLMPSAAEIQLRQSTDRNVANQLALASALQGRSPGGALKQASDASGAINAQAAGDAAALRANEQAAARNTLAQTLYGVRAGDITPEITNAQLGNATGIANAGNVTTTGIANAHNLTNVSQSNAAQANDLTSLRASLANAAGISSANNATSASQTNANNSTQLVGQQAQINQQSAVDNAANMLKARGLDDDQIARFMQSLVTSKGQDLGFTTDTQRNLISQQLGLGGLDIDRQRLALAISQQSWNQAKDVLNTVGTGAAAIGSSQWFQNLLNGTSSNSATASDYSPNLSSSNYGNADVWTATGNQSGETTGEPELT